MQWETNVTLFRMINDLGKEYEYVNPIFIFIAEYTVFLLAGMLLMYWFTRTKNNRIMAISALIAFVAAEITGKLAGKLHSNENPFAELSGVSQLIEKEINNSFPSDHTILFFSICMTFVFFRKKGSYIWLILAFLVGVSRVWVGVHYPADILAGAAIATISAYICYRIVPSSKVIHQLLGFYETMERKVWPEKHKSRDK
ncbi:MAG: undecaprenyl-diphosphatase [Bacillus sp. (in: firmicutes)]